ncbi:uncharacterized protein LOC117964550 isoform X2 [Acipenser ruthenus]|uniref:uncharacterized protein LOC117964550 isoform X2 n=1 Tax=Acipenser ruthenus TaxID=7906 RepID=UPI00274244BF|nr:uncharacterized protein LOC117964550 isoform X2 [Acipenser ruthenus]
MAFRSKVADTKTVILHLLLCLAIFYTLYYMIGSVCFGAFNELAVDAAHLFQQRAPVCRGGEALGVGLCHHCHPGACWTDLRRCSAMECLIALCSEIAECCLSSSNAGVPSCVAVVAGSGQWLVPDDLQWSADCVLCLRE